MWEELPDPPDGFTFTIRSRFDVTVVRRADFRWPRYWLSRLTGGRPMRLLYYLFTDVVSGRKVWMFQDRLGRKWMAEGRWSWFRVKVPR